MHPDQPYDEAQLSSLVEKTVALLTPFLKPPNAQGPRRIIMSRRTNNRTHHGTRSESQAKPVVHPVDEGAKAQLTQQIREIFVGAAKLDEVFMESRANFTLDFLDGQRSFDRGVMEAAWDESLDASARVGFVIAPVLWKNGLADGRGYEATSVLVKAKVVCGSQEEEG
jgi:hypothetical protein